MFDRLRARYSAATAALIAACLLIGAPAAGAALAEPDGNPAAAADPGASGSTATAAASVAWTSPVPGGVLMDGFGPRGTAMHKGIDIACTNGVTPILAPRAGRVAIGAEQGWYGGGFGIFVMIDHGDGTATGYGHLSAARVSAGQTVRGGDVIGICGATEVADGAAHLHFELRINFTVGGGEGPYFAATPIDPLGRISLAAAGSPPRPVSTTFTVRDWPAATTITDGGWLLVTGTALFGVSATNPNPFAVRVTVNLPCGDDWVTLGPGAIVERFCFGQASPDWSTPASTVVTRDDLGELGHRTVWFHLRAA